jgi:NAD(P)-dependent dehydrogenase (short-subunit alcohol dehydrogenase family)
MPVAIITGASEGFGRALAEDLAEEGWRLVIDGRDADHLTLAADAIRNLGATVDAIVGDVTDEAHRADLVEAATQSGHLDLVVNNASTLGPSPLPPLLSYPLAAYEDVLRTNVVAPLALLQLTLPALTASGGTIVDISSDAAVEGYEGWGGYGSAKAALDQVTRVLAAEHPDLHVYSFDPGDMRTRMHQDAFPGEDISDRPLPATVVPALRRLLREAPPSGRYRAVDLLVAEP